MSYKHGAIAERFFSNMLFQRGINFRFIDDWYDYIVSKDEKVAYVDDTGPDSIKVELKSCRMIIKHNKKDKEHVRPGVFYFPNEETRKKLKEHNVWIALVIREGHECLFYGFMNSKQLNGQREVPITSLRSFKILGFDDWCLEVGIKRKIRDCPFCGRGLII